MKQYEARLTASSSTPTTASAYQQTQQQHQAQPSTSYTLTSRSTQVVPSDHRAVTSRVVARASSREQQSQEQAERGDGHSSSAMDAGSPESFSDIGVSV